ncbi:hypothetical protein P3S67_020446 [Capsicum chacoense]
MCMAYGRACDALGSCLPDMLRDTTFSSCLREDSVTRMWLQELLQKVDGNLDALQAGGSLFLPGNCSMMMTGFGVRKFYNSIFTKIGVIKIKRKLFSSFDAVPLPHRSLRS